MSQDLPVTRYHSLAGTHLSLPGCLEITSWIAGGPDGGKGIIMGVRHKELLVEGVQFHPESILTEEGTAMIRNFLRMKGGTWRENSAVSPNLSNGTPKTNGSSKSSILEEIYAHSRQALERQKCVPSQRLLDLEAMYGLDLYPPLISFPDRLRRSPFPLALAAEVKRASPSKGDIAPFVNAPVKSKEYALAGASVISVLTEPKWFKGSIEDLRAVRQSLAGMPDRPAVLRKDFIFDEYQILEARLAGADTVLLIVKMLTHGELGRLYAYSKSLGMEPLVEVNTPEEMQVALKLKAQVIGINNRNLTSFDVDLGTTGRLMTNVPKETIICALSGITGAQDVATYRSLGVGAILVGEALMRQADILRFVSTLMAAATPTSRPRYRPMVKICGTREAEAAKVAVEAGADFVGMILVPGRTRTVSQEAALAISKVVHSTPKPTDGPRFAINKPSQGYFDFMSSSFRRRERALLVGVFQNQPLDFIIQQQLLLDLDIVQLHGSEPLEWATLIPVPVIRRFSPRDPGINSKPYHSLPLLDTPAGGTGQQLDIEVVRETLKDNPDLHIVLAGGLKVENIAAIVQTLNEFSHQIAAVDVSSGVEEDGRQSLKKIKAFIKMAKT